MLIFSLINDRILVCSILHFVCQNGFYLFLLALQSFALVIYLFESSFSWFQEWMRWEEEIVVPISICAQFLLLLWSVAVGNVITADLPRQNGKLWKLNQTKWLCMHPIFRPKSYSRFELRSLPVKCMPIKRPPWKMLSVAVDNVTMWLYHELQWMPKQITL